MTWNTTIIACLMVLVAGLTGGCRERDYYDIALLNKTDRDVNDAMVTGATGPVTMGVIIRGSGKTWSSFAGRPPDSLTVSWRDLEGKAHMLDVNLAGVVPSRFRGTIYVKIRPNDAVQAAAYGEHDVAGAVKYETSP